MMIKWASMSNWCVVSEQARVAKFEGGPVAIPLLSSEVIVSVFSAFQWICNVKIE